MFSKTIIILILLNLPFSLGCATNRSSWLDEKEKSSYNLITEPPGAKIVIKSKPGDEDHEYVSPSTISLPEGHGFIEISKEGYWNEQRLVMQTVDIKFERNWGEMATGAIVGGAAGAIVMAPIMPDMKLIPKPIMTDQTQFQLAILEQGSANPMSFNPTDYRSYINDNTINIKLKEISANLKPIMSSLKTYEERSYKESKNRIDKLYSEGKISKEEFLRAKKKMNDIYYGRSQRKI